MRQSCCNNFPRSSEQNWDLNIALLDAYHKTSHIISKVLLGTKYGFHIRKISSDHKYVRTPHKGLAFELSLWLRYDE